MKYDLVYLGAPRSGTTSMFEMLSKHHNITSSFVKEPLNVNKKECVFKQPHLYVYNFQVKSHTKVLLDGTPDIYYQSDELVEGIKKLEWVSDIKLIYTIRNPIDRIKSYLLLMQTLIYLHNHEWAQKWYKGDAINKDVFFEKIGSLKDSINLQNAQMITEKILVCNLNSVDSKEIFRFLKLEERDFKIEHLNGYKRWMTSGIITDVNIDLFLEDHKKLLKEIFLKDLEEVRKYYQVNIEDILKQVEGW